MNIEMMGPGGGAFLFAVLLVCLTILVNARLIADKLDVMDHPDAFRKRHGRSTPLVGGMAIMIPVLLWTGATLLWLNPVDAKLLLVIVLCGGGATLVGYADDQSSTSPSSRLLSLFLLTAVALVVDPDLVPTHLNWGSFDPTALPVWFGFTLIAIAMAGYVNAVNMADGQNGIVTGMYAIWAVCLMITCGGGTAAVALVMLCAVFLTFVFNMAGRTFLGDAGTYGVSFAFGILAVSAHNTWNVSAETIVVWFFIPVLDCIRLMVSRSLQGQAPSAADRNHFHHRLQDRVGKTYGLMIYLGVVGCSSLIVSLIPHLSLVCMVVLAAFYFSFAWLTEAEAEQAEETDTADETSPSAGVIRFESKSTATDRK